MTGRDAPIVVVGGGISGIASALLLADRGREVVLIEQEETLGGLLRSHQGPEGNAFDRGTHFVLGTGIPELDTLLVGDLPSSEWMVFDHSLHEGHVFAGELNTDTGCIDTRALPAHLHRQVREEMMSRDAPDGTPETLEEELLSAYGPAVTNHIYRPVLHKLTGCDLSKLAPGTHRDFQLQRLVIAGSSETLDLKQDPWVDARVAYTKIEDGTSSIRKLYPRQGGIQRWIDHLEEQLRARGVELALGAGVTEVATHRKRVTSVHLEDGAKQPVAELVWAIPPALLLRMAGEPVPGSPPPRRDLHLVHLTVDRPVGSDRYYVNLFDPDLLSFRVTLYPNFTQETPAAPPHHLTVEVLGDAPASDQTLVERVSAEMVQVGVLPPDSERLYDRVERIRGALTIRTKGHEKGREETNAQVAKVLPDVTLVGPGSTETHGMIPALTHVHRMLGHGEHRAQPDPS